MPDLDRYAKQTSSGEDASVVSLNHLKSQIRHHLILKVNVHGMYTNVFNNLVRK